MEFPQASMMFAPGMPPGMHGFMDPAMLGAGFGAMQQLQPRPPAFPPQPRPQIFEGIDENSRRPGSLNGSFFHKTRMCQKWQEGSCTFGDRCHFAHGQQEIRKLPPDLVRQFEAQKAAVQQARAAAQVAATAATGGGATPAAPGPAPVSAAPPTSTPGPQAAEPGATQPPGREYFYKTRLCDKFMSGAGCPYGARCHYAHGEHELRNKGETKIENGVAIRITPPAQPLAPMGAPPMLGMPGMPAMMLPPGVRPPPPRPPPGPPPADASKASMSGLASAVSTAKPTPLSEVTYVDKIRAMSALFSVGDLKLQEVNPGALHAVAVSLKDGSLFAGNHYADSLTEI
eukprot:jgi/Astpho2/8101/fgenesh1_pg.00120_%23_62_t